MKGLILVNQGKDIVIIFLLLLFFTVFNSTHTSAQIPFNRGVNFTNWFQASSARQIQFSKFSKNDFENIKSLGCDVVRLPINLNFMTSGEPEYTLDPLFLGFLDQAVDWAEETQTHLILDNHTFDPAVDTDPNIGPILVKVWTQMAEHFKDRSDYIYYEVLNEPHGISDQDWGAIQQTVIDAIRTKDTKHFIVVGPANWNSYNSLANLPEYTDPKLIYTFHFYDPFIFTHQGATWVEPSMLNLSGVPFPYKASGMPATPQELKGTWIADALHDYPGEGTVARVKQLIDVAVSFKNQRNVPVFCGEFGVYIPNSSNADRVFWYETVHQYLTQKGIPWTLWDYTGGFGLFKKDTEELFDYDLNVPLLEALNFNVPEQKAYFNYPRLAGFPIYDDYIREGIVEVSYLSNGILNYYSEIPKEGKYNIYWTGVDRYDAISLDFRPNLNLSLLREYDFTLQFWMKCNNPLAKFDIRFIDTKASAEDHPWRMGKTISAEVVPFDGGWHFVEIPLKNMEEKGSWDKDWFNPEGKFDWSKIDKFEIVPEHQALDGIEFQFDEIKISGEEIVNGIERAPDLKTFTVYPNPMKDATNINISLSRPSMLKVEVYDIYGRKVKELENKWAVAGDYQFSWNVAKEELLTTAVYIIRAETNNGVRLKKVIVNK